MKPILNTTKPTANQSASITDPQAIIAVYESHPDAEAAIAELQKGGFDMKKLSIVGKDYHSEEQVVGFYNRGDRMKYWGRMGAFWGGIWGLLFGAAFFVIPGIGPVLIAGPLVATLAAALENAIVVGGLSALGAALYSIGIPRNSILKYEAAVKVDKYLLVAHGTADEIIKARQILNATKPTSLEEHTLTAAQPAAAS